MDKGRLAENVLSHAMEAPLAEVVVGDLLESGAARTDRWFWSNVGQTLAASVWRDVKAQPLFVLGLAFRGALFLGALLFFVAEARGWFSGLAGSLFSDSRLAQQPREWLWPAMRLVSLFATLYAGRWIAQRSFGKDLAVCVAMLIVFPFVDYGFTSLAVWYSALDAHGEVLLPGFGRFWCYWRDVGSLGAFLVGVALVRHRRQISAVA